MDYKFIQNKVSNKWVISSPRRANRPNENVSQISECPFCVGKEDFNNEAYSIGGSTRDANWKLRVIPNKFPFAPIHEIVIHSQDHHKNFDELPLTQTLLILETYRDRFILHKDKGQVCIFHNHGEASGESQPHPHSQIVVLPDFMSLDIPAHDPSEALEGLKTEYLSIFAPSSSEWPDELWISPLKASNYFSSITDEELLDLAKVLYRLIQIMDLRHGHEFPYNFYISPHKEWYLRLVPRLKVIGGFEIGTNVWVNTQDPKETMAFVKEHFENPDENKIRHEQQAEYEKAV